MSRIGTEPGPGGPLRTAGKAVTILWFAGFMLLTVAAVFGQSGSFAWMSAWQHRLFGSDNVVISFLPGVILAMVPLFAAGPLAHRWPHPFTLGMQDGVKRLTERTSPASLPDPRRSLLRQARVHLALAVLSAAVGGGVALYILRTTGQHEGEPLPVLDYAAAAAPGTPLPPHVRLAGVAPQPGAAWVHDYTFRSDHHRDVYTPLVPPGWRPGDPVRLLLEDVVFVHDDGSSRTPPTALEGAPARDGVPGWMVDAMRAAGIALSDHPLLVEREKLGGVQPGPDTIAALVPELLGGSTCATFLLLAGMAWRERRRFPP